MLAARDLALAGRLDVVSALFAPGQVTAICGPNGAGKSSLLATLAGLLSPDSGDVRLGGQALAALAPAARARAIGFLPQAPEAAWDVSVETLVALGRLPWRGQAGAAEHMNTIAAALATMDLAEHAARPLSRLSGGERARAHLARVLAGQPRWLLADEPLANLDLAHARTLVETLKGQARGGAGVVLVLHDLAGAMNQADRVLVLHQGRVAADGPPEQALTPEVIARCWGVTARWLGEPGARALLVDPAG